MDDSEIISMLEIRNEDALSELEARYSAYLKRIAMNVLGSEPDAEECVNETFFRAWRKIPPAKPDNLAAYLGKIARELAIDVYRTKKKRRETVTGYDESVAELAFISSQSDGVEQTVDGLFLRDAVASFLKSVSEKERNVFIRRYFFFDSVRDISEMYGIGGSSVKVILFRSRNKLKKYLEREGYGI